ncbi:hypothetical protein EFL45_04055 [Weissella confusa]|nr:hypothetical protein [Weissella confusa]
MSKSNAISASITFLTNANMTFKTTAVGVNVQFTGTATNATINGTLSKLPFTIPTSIPAPLADVHFNTPIVYGIPNVTSRDGGYMRIIFHADRSIEYVSHSGRDGMTSSFTSDFTINDQTNWFF